MIGKLMKLLVNGTDFSRGDIVMILTDEHMPLAWHYLSQQPMRVNRAEVVTLHDYDLKVAEYESLHLEGIEESENVEG